MLASLALLVALMLPQKSPLPAPPRLPPPPPADLTLPPETATTVTILEGRGVQIYTCGEQAGGYAWVLKAPEAQLFNLATGRQQGRHDAGPTWTLDDGSAIRGTVLQKKAADTAGDVPWLLLKADALSRAKGVLTPVNYVRRYNTHGGVAPATGCDAGHAGAALKVPYTATYGFYAVPQ